MPITDLPFRFKDSTGSYEVNLHRVEKSSNKTISINGKNYKVSGGDDAVSQLRSHITKSNFKTFESFAKSVSKHIDPKGKENVLFHKILGKQEDVSIKSKPCEKITSQIKESTGTFFEIGRLLTGVSIKKQMPELLDLTFELVNRGELKKASNLFSFLQNHLPPQERIENFMRLGNAFAEYAEKHSDVIALDCAEFHFCMTRQSDNPDVLQLGESLIAKTHDKLKELATSGTEDQRKYARNLLDKIRIDDLMYESSFDEAFKLAAVYQSRIDTVDAPKPYHTNSQVIEIQDGERTLPIHVIVTGQRQKRNGVKDPVVILEPGLGCIASDWQLVQDRLPQDIQAISYDREGMAWSGKNEPASPERSISVLRSLLKDRGIDPPYIFVGHSYGGFLGQLYALEYSDEIVGMVLVDSAIEAHTPDPISAPQNEGLPPAAQMRFMHNEYGDFLDTPTASIVSTIRTTTNQQKTFEEELNTGLPHARDLLLEKLHNNPQPFAFPLKVITAGIFVPDKNKTEEENKTLEKLWNAEQKLLKGRSTSSKSAQVIAPKSDHFIMYYDHTLICEQITSLFG